MTSRCTSSRAFILGIDERPRTQQVAHGIQHRAAVRRFRRGPCYYTTAGSGVRSQRLALSASRRSGVVCSASNEPDKAAAADATVSQMSRRAVTRAVTLSAAALSLSSRVDSAHADVPALEQPTVTTRVYFDIGACPAEEAQNSRLLGDSAICNDVFKVGRIVIGLYGDLLPQTVENFLTLVKTPENGFKDTVFHTVRPGQYISAGRQGQRRRGQLESVQLASNPELTSAASFKLKHLRPGTVSLTLTDEDSKVQRGRSEFSITTGPGPAPSLDGSGIVFGRVEQGLDVVTLIAAAPTYLPPKRVRVMNDLASSIKDDRAKGARAVWSRPRAPVVIMDCGVL
eukprot:CAMPEP_0198200722 /NCGR_PEP_ID=MMETSP1445-20131203/3684_1 /TAXON_ID=36898 /ORGANISM="Pyramimonas sp., Strain CCMP2087" /LENGTH=341 /DNA_ID=CAMNT_0043870861 /DNA_START=99 /DNA_END=1124 /DNA_ORIENTATION=+